MPRKPPTKVIEHRISLSDFERSRLKEYLSTQRINSTISSTGQLVGGIGVPLLGLAALWWVSFSLDELIDDIFGPGGFVDNTSDKIKTKLEKDGYVNYEADEYGREVVKIQMEMETLWIENNAVHARMSQTGPPFSDADVKAINKINKRMDILSKREKVLRSLIAKIAAGEIKGYAVQMTGDDEWRDKVFRESLSADYEAEYESMYGEEVDIDDSVWELGYGEGGPDQV